jgi:hypothetical protein
MQRRQNKDKVRFEGEVPVIAGSHPEFPMVIRSECRQEEGTEEENRSQVSDLSVGSDHRWIEENLHDI